MKLLYGRVLSGGVFRIIPEFFCLPGPGTDITSMLFQVFTHTIKYRSTFLHTAVVTKTHMPFL